MEDNTDQIKIRHISQSICFRIIDRGIKLSGTMLQPELTFTNDERILEINFGKNNTLRSINISQNSKEHTIQNSLHFRH